MFRKKTYRIAFAMLASLLAVTLASSASASPGRGGFPAGVVPPGAVIRQATPASSQAALAAASLPGAVTEVAPGLTLRQAVGLDPAPTIAPMNYTAPTQRRLAAAMDVTTCWNYGHDHTWDSWTQFWQQTLEDSTYFCGNSAGTLTYRSSHFGQYQSACQPTGTYSWKNSGGVGYTFVAWHEGGTWHCQSPYPWLASYPNDWMDMLVNGSGTYTQYQSN